MCSKNIAIVTGANGGLGKEFVKLLIQRSDIREIWAIARDENKLGQLKTELGDKIRTFSIDLSDLGQIKKFGVVIEQEAPAVKYLINNAGYAKFCSYADLSLEESINMIDVNVSGVVAMGLICIPHMESGSHIINIASQASFQPLPYQNIYSSTKAFVRNYTRALNVELKEKGICATAVCPGWIRTGLFERGLIGAQKAANHFPHMTSPEVVAKKALKDADKQKDMSVYSLYTKMCHLVSKLIPQKWMMKMWRWQQKI